MLVAETNTDERGVGAVRARVGKYLPFRASDNLVISDFFLFFSFLSRDRRDTRGMSRETDSRRRFRLFRHWKLAARRRTRLETLVVEFCSLVERIGKRIERDFPRVRTLKIC